MASSKFSTPNDFGFRSLHREMRNFRIQKLFYWVDLNSFGILLV